MLFRSMITEKMTRDAITRDGRGWHESGHLKNGDLRMELECPAPVALARKSVALTRIDDTREPGDELGHKGQ